MSEPVLYMIAGPNGAGKTTTAMRLLPEFLSINRFVNADEIAYKQNPLDPDSQKISAGRRMLALMRELVDGQQSFAFETTGANLSSIQFLKRAKIAGYTLRLIFLWLPSPEFAQQRVASRVAQGGHNIDTDVIERRYYRGLQNLELYAALMDSIEIYHNISPIEERGQNLIYRFQGNMHEVFDLNLLNMVLAKGQKN